MERLEKRKVDTVSLVKSYVENDYYSNLLIIQSSILQSMREFMISEGFLEILPVIISPITDPLNHDIFDASIDYYGYSYSITKSMILQKQVSTLVTDRIFSMSPNLRLELENRYEDKRHLIEFVQMDMEVANAKREEVMDIMERLLIRIISEITVKHTKIIEKYNSGLVIPKKNFKRIRVQDAIEKYGDSYEKILSANAKEPFWLIDIPIMDREFYDKQNPNDPDFLLDFDLIYPFGYGEAISGGEREHEYDQIIKRMDLKGNSKNIFKDYLDLSKEGLLKPTAGCGIGIERLTRYILGLEHIEKARLFAKSPGKISI
ncbi:asparagine synthetase A [Geotoga petraea]|jgi:asparaginyl-tRNA synthetase|uniref:Asparagine synthetase n=1 Tax=Geotoga petraea TaxID=28234 RepID=A0A1G6K7R3_9BACT|nr:asparagine synthetase A [Geotoga petraea]TGG88434.1 asparagine synthetase [Geotoga petraea]SDC26366.1 aspartate-ammonia ligase [Geotoga petraea]